ncbi:MAG: Rrf2 family transcriptional regulator [Candidatus Marinimicrobia bacterium]|nr:Rrf2 family transcriptional regulator [Candidatus Neomarinimicrobiota bacterium]
MLKLTRKTEYALIALRHMQNSDNVVSSSREISALYNIPYPLLSKVLQKLAKVDILKPVHGPRGGYKIKVDLERISLTDFFEAMEGPWGIMDCSFYSNCELVPTCNIQDPIKRINRNIRTMFDNLTICDVTN